MSPQDLEILQQTEATLAWYSNPEIYKPHPNGVGFGRRDLSFAAQAPLANLRALLARYAAPMPIEAKEETRTQGSWYREKDIDALEDRAATAEADKNAILQVIKHHSGEDHGVLGVRKLVDRATDAEAEREDAIRALRDVTTSLMAAVSLLRSGGKSAAPSNSMFEQMLADYTASIERGRSLLQSYTDTGPRVMSVIKDVAAERIRQIEVKGYTPEHDDGWTDGQLMRAGICYLKHAIDRAWVISSPDLGLTVYQADPPDGSLWPWSDPWWKPESPDQDMIRGTALIIAEIERARRAKRGSQSHE